MTISFIIFIASILVLGIYIALKQRELACGEAGVLARFLQERSPRLEARFDSMAGMLSSWIHKIGGVLKHCGLRLFAKIRATLRGIVVLVAAKMVRSVKGEKLLFSQTAPSLYLKRLKNEMEKPEETAKDSVSE